jgi:hypothetical protein
MELITENKIATLLSMERRTVKKLLAKIPTIDGKYASDRVLKFNSEGEITGSEAIRALNIARREQIQLEMEILRKERLPIEDLHKIINEAFSAVAATLKASLGKTLDEKTLNELLGQLRSGV